jgi:hypothetical protein
MAQILCLAEIPCGSEPAREGSDSVSAYRRLLPPNNDPINPRTNCRPN